MSIKKSEAFSMAFVLAVVVVFAIRPLFPSFYDRMYGVDIGTWNMYSYDLVADVDLRLISASGEIPIDPLDHIWHGRFATSSHPHYSEEVVHDFLAGLRSTPRIQALIEKHQVEKIAFKMKLIKNFQHWKTIVAELDVR